ncbi:hypothetical protein GCM10025857_12910 [Alicyclobacillus contaminans]|uniref:hypothetical protein n=1 Tax=Alicyclobacillus contaminans TaxID=392016 RepID=UPI0003F521F8|nr:hypothetical protein [Alicyclobacillus contaminans]GMA49934.1 hypothetical protein GCM10025857_12910 [Alicyclobacillus contaminans]
MKKWVGAMAVCVTMLGATAPAAMASTSTKTTGQIVVNNDSKFAPNIIRQGGYDYMPVWYVIQALKGLGIQGQWRGNSWYITDPSVSVATPSNPGKGNISVYVNRHLVARISSLVAKDPSSHKPTTYLRVNDMSQVLKSLNLSSVLQGGTWTLETPEVKALEDAFANTNAAPQSELTSKATMHLQLNLTDQGKADIGDTSSAMDMEMSMDAVNGTVNGEKASLITITITSSTPTGSGDASNVSQTINQTIQEYVQGNRIWINQGDGWTEDTASEQIAQGLESQLPMNNVSFSMLRNIKVSQSGNTSTYTATLDGSSMAQILDPILNSLGDSVGGTGDLSTTQVESIVNTILHNLNGSLNITVQPVNNQSVITGEQLTLDLDVPISQLPIPESEKSTVLAELTGFTIHETATYNFTYDNVTITPPVDTSSASSSN